MGARRGDHQGPLEKLASARSHVMTHVYYSVTHAFLAELLLTKFFQSKPTVSNSSSPCFCLYCYFYVAPLKSPMTTLLPDPRRSIFVLWLFWFSAESDNLIWPLLPSLTSSLSVNSFPSLLRLHHRLPWEDRSGFVLSPLSTLPEKPPFTSSASLPYTCWWLQPKLLFSPEGTHILTNCSVTAPALTLQI